MSSDSISLLDAIILGIIQGLTEFFPVSSDGHLVVVQALLDYHKNNLAFDVFLHIGTLAATVLIFRTEVKTLISRTLHFPSALKVHGLSRLKSPTEDERWMLYIWITTLITGILGLTFEKKIESYFTSAAAAGVGFLITSAVLFFGAFRSRLGIKRPEQLSYWLPVCLGIAQASALMPGISRSGMTIATAFIFGIRREDAGRYSFTAAVPIIAMACLYEMRKVFREPPTEFPIWIVGALVSFIVGMIAIWGLLAMLKRLSLFPFAFYTFAIGIWTLWHFS